MSRSHWRLLGLTLVLGAAVCSRVATLSAQLPRLIMNEVTADFAVSVDPPLLKSKYNLYDPDGITMQQFDKAIGYDRRFDLHLSNVPFAKGNIRIFRIDKQHASAVDGAEEALVPVETFTNVDTAKWSWIGMVPRNSTIYFEAEDGSGLSDMTPVKVGKLIRINRYYPERGKTKSYADFDRKTWIARLGMADSQQADQEIGALAEALPDTLDVAVKVDGKLRKQDANSLLGVRLDYRVNGKYIRSVLFHGSYGVVDLYDKKRTAAMPWGFKQQPDSAVAVGDLSRFQIAVKKYAPADWTGTVHITFLMQNAGPGTRARIALRPGA